MNCIMYMHCTKIYTKIGMLGMKYLLHTVRDFKKFTYCTVETNVVTVLQLVKQKNELLFYSIRTCMIVITNC